MSLYSGYKFYNNNTVRSNNDSYLLQVLAAMGNIGKNLKNTTIFEYFEIVAGNGQHVSICYPQKMVDAVSCIQMNDISQIYLNKIFYFQKLYLIALSRTIFCRFFIKNRNFGGQRISIKAHPLRTSQQRRK